MGGGFLASGLAGNQSEMQRMLHIAALPVIPVIRRKT
jgi:hypothetical protein